MPVIKAVRVGDDVYPYDSRAVTIQELTQLKIQAGLTMSDMLNGDLDDPRVWIAMIWLARRRDGEFKLRYDEVDAKWSEIDLEFEDEEEAEETPTPATLPDSGSGSPNVTPEPNEPSTSGATIDSPSPKSGTSPRGTKTASK